MCDVTGEWELLDADTVTDRILKGVQFGGFNVVFLDFRPIDDVIRLVAVRHRPSIIEYIDARNLLLGALSAANQQIADEYRRETVYNAVKNIYLKYFVIGEADGD